MTTLKLTRREITAGLALVPLFAIAAGAQTAAPAIHVSKDPSCDCCRDWIAHLRAAGFLVTVTDTRDMAAIKRRLGVPEKLASCHTAEIGRYVIEGHVPAAVIVRFVAEKPEGARGLAVPDMPVGSPGMEAAGVPPDTYDVIAFGNFGQRRYARFEGAREIKV